MICYWRITFAPVLFGFALSNLFWGPRIVRWVLECY